MTNSNPKELPEWKLYLAQFPGLWAGRPVPISNIQREELGDISGATEPELQLIIEIARRQLDALSEQLEQIRQRAQFLFSTLLLLIGAAAALLPTIATKGGIGPFIIWAVSFGVLIAAVLGTSGIVVNSKVMGAVDSGWITRQDRPWLTASAQDHLDAVEPSWRTVATHVTLLRDSALLTILGVIGIAAAWCWAVL